MCGHCGVTAGKVACGSIAAGVLGIVLAVAEKLFHFEIAHVGPRPFAVGAALMLLLSIAISCKQSCGEACKEEPHTH